MSPTVTKLYRLRPENDDDNDAGEKNGTQVFHKSLFAEHEDLPYKVELWDDACEMVEQILAVTSNSSIGYGAYYAAVKQFPSRPVTLRYKNRVISRSIQCGH
jgi:hypothetical protein